MITRDRKMTSELALDEIYKALDRGEKLTKKEIEERSRKEYQAGRSRSPSRVMKEIKRLAPNFGIKIEG